MLEDKFYYAIYKSSRTSKKIATAAQKDLFFAPSILYENETYNLEHTYHIATESQLKSFENMCSNLGIETKIGF